MTTRPAPTAADPNRLLVGRARAMFDVAHDHLAHAEQLARHADDPDACMAQLGAARAIVYALAGLTAATMDSPPWTARGD